MTEAAYTSETHQLREGHSLVLLSRDLAATLTDHQGVGAGTTGPLAEEHDEVAGARALVTALSSAAREGSHGGRAGGEGAIVAVCRCSGDVAIETDERGLAG